MNQNRTKQLALFTLALFPLIFSCNLEPKSYTEEISKMEDTLFKAFPTVNRVSIEVKDDFGTEVNITLGDAELYTASDSKKKEVANKAALITQYIFSKEKPEKGSVIFVKEENTIKVDENTKKIYPMSLSTP
jgi:hypothetical protein